MEMNIVIKVFNQGDVIAEQEIEQIFQPFFRGGNAIENAFQFGVNQNEVGPKFIGLLNGIGAGRNHADDGITKFGETSLEIRGAVFGFGHQNFTASGHVFGVGCWITALQREFWKTNTEDVDLHLKSLLYYDVMNNSNNEHYKIIKPNCKRHLFVLYVLLKPNSWDLR